MKKLICLFIFALLFPVAAGAALDPVLKECMQRGYEAVNEGDLVYCRFPSGRECLIQDFNKGICAPEFKHDSYCVPEGRTVWDADKCCPGSEAYLPPNHTGQTSCVKITTFQKMIDHIRYSMIVGTILFLPLWIDAVAIGFVILLVVVWRKKKSL